MRTVTVEREKIVSILEAERFPFQDPVLLRPCDRISGLRLCQSVEKTLLP